ncbi:hypothetical protein DPMN_172652 [Dreissena polymorpha]|uniref:Uncharacterized protein n=1 Tax=Dreissena polymorpha TaxID=45954 RepID=A0A9D4IG96_DREPO|nr:hypothetical protein DPMN_172652 [Dreissena polymorpha]
MYFKTSSVFENKQLSTYNLEKRAPMQLGATHEQVCIADYCKVGGVTVQASG